MRVKAFLKAMADTLFPYIPKCAICGVEKDVTDYLCPECSKEIESLRAGESYIGDIYAYSLYKYDGPIKSIVRGYKYNGKKWLAPFLGADMAAVLKKLTVDISCVCGVPLHEKRRKWRGFDQAEELARRISEASSIPYIPAIKRMRNTKTQTKLNERERADNIKGAFEAVKQVSGNVLLVDDVLTTGATAGECAHVLKAAGAKEVYVLTYAKAAHEAGKFSDRK